MEDEAVLDREASFLKHVCDEEEVEGKRLGLLGRKDAFALVFVCRMGTVGGQRDGGCLWFAQYFILKLTETWVGLVGVEVTF